MANAREKLAEKIIDLFKDNAYAFGGYLRDKIAGQDFTDLDLFFPTYSEGNINSGYTPLGRFDVRRALRNAGLVILLKESKKIYNNSSGMRLHKDSYSVRDPSTGTTITVDLVRSDNYDVTTDHPFTSLDASVNALWWNKKTGKVETAPGMPYTMEQIMAHIAQKVFEIPDGVTIQSDRINKLFKKGYKHLDSNSQPATERKDSKMESRGFMDQFKADMEKAAYRSTGTQVTKAVKNGILTAMKSQGADEGALVYVTKVLDSEVGTAGISALLGHGLPHAPMIGTDPRVTRLAEEFRVAGYSEGLNLIFGLLMQFIMPGIMQALQNLPPVTVTEKDMKELDAISKAQIRVAAPPQVPNLDLAAEREHEAELELQRQRQQRRTA